MKREGIKVTAAKDTITISGERKCEADYQLGIMPRSERVEASQIMVESRVSWVIRR